MAEFDIMYGEGISKLGEIVDIVWMRVSCRKAVPGTAMTAPNWGRVVKE